MTQERNNAHDKGKFISVVLSSAIALCLSAVSLILFGLDTAEGYDISKTYPEIADALKEKLEAFRKEMKTNRRGITDKERS